MAAMVAPVDANQRLRKECLMLVAKGITQKALAGAMGMRQGTFSKWLRGKPGIRPPSVNAWDGLQAYKRELSKALIPEETQRSAAAADEHHPAIPPGAAGSRFPEQPVRKRTHAR